MSDQVTLDLIQTVLDEEASPTEAAELETITSHSDDARADLESMRELFGEIERSGVVPLPLGLRDDILTRIRAQAGAPGSSPVIFADAASRLRKRQWIVAACAAAAAIAILVLMPLNRPDVDDSPGRLSGAMVARPQPQWSEVARVGSPAGLATAALRRSGDSLALDATLATEGAVTILWEPTALVLRSGMNTGELVLACPAGRCPPVAFHSSREPARIVVTLPGGETLDLVEPAP